MVKDVQLWRRPQYRRVDGSFYKYKHYMFEQNDDPDSSYVLTLDNAKKILAIHQRLKYVLNNSTCADIMECLYGVEIIVLRARHYLYRPMLSCRH